MTEASPAVARVPSARVALASASVYTESTAAAFEIAARLGYDGVEIMVWTDPVSQDVTALRRLSDYHQVPILALHAPCLVITQRVWGTDPWAKLVRAKDAAEEVGAETVVVHPPFRWQREYARQFVGGIEQMAGETGVKFAVENMFPLRARGREVTPYAEGPRVPRSLSRTGLERLVDVLAGMRAVDRSRLPGVSPQRAHQLLAGAVVAHEALTALDLETVDVCPWALREGVILRRLDWLAGT